MDLHTTGTDHRLALAQPKSTDPEMAMFWHRREEHAPLTLLEEDIDTARTQCAGATSVSPQVAASQEGSVKASMDPSDFRIMSYEY